MRLVPIRNLILLAIATYPAIAQQAPQDATIQALLKEVHALRLAMEQSNQTGPRIQIALARIQLQEERVRNATRQLQDARDKVADIQTRRARFAEGIRR